MSLEIKQQIQNAINNFNKGDLFENSINLFNTLGYNTERQDPLNKPSFKVFKETYINSRSNFNESKAQVEQWKSIHLLFQLSKVELSKQSSLFDTKRVDNTIIETYLFFAIELTQESYNRSALAQITRELNRLFPMPVMILFKHGSLLTLSVINRRLHKRDDSKDVLEKVTLIKDINIEKPHRAHIEILYDLSFQVLEEKNQFSNFVELHNAWQKTLDTKELNKRFYNELFNWYLWAISLVSFPNDLKDDKDDTIYNSESVIRLLTRLIFVWFIKEKDLVPEILFDEKKLKNILKNFNSKSVEESTYYRAILQNLFFATLNTPMDKDAENNDEKRRFINILPKSNNPDYKDQTRYRYEDYFINSVETLKLFSNIPFLNGGLFECLDMVEEGIRYDGFSSTEGSQAIAPDVLFFSDDYIYDLNSEYGTKGKKYKVKGLINILNSYKFTITENTPLEEEIALDPELLGKVFENLLASYNPETKTTARKQTGSFYTPREIVNYMVDESLLAYLKQKLYNSDVAETKLRNLFYTTSDNEIFSDTEKSKLIKAISEAKILDPACGSGAFPMGILHRLVDLLNKLDKDNTQWFALQKERAIAETAEVFNNGDTSEREIRLLEINKAFDMDMNYPDYARKLFLIENCIYGVDIQQIAIQISKLRFFISLIVDQKVDDNKPNRNILSMPNLETKFVAANTLISIEKPKGQLSLMDMNNEIADKEKQLKSIRHQIFFTRKYSQKKKLKENEKKCREELKTILINNNMDKTAAQQLTEWNPFDPMKSAAFFDTETMFGISNKQKIKHGNLQNNEITLFNKQIEAFNKQIESINISFQLKQEQSIIKLKLITATLQTSIVEAELKTIQQKIEELHGRIENNIISIVKEKEDITYAVNALNKNIKTINLHISDLEKLLKPVEPNDDGSFDIVLGNPPYVSNKEILREHKIIFDKIFKVAVGQYDLFNLFIEKSVNLLKYEGSHSFIIPDSFLGRSTFKNCRLFFLDNLACYSILHFNNVFEEAVVSSIVYSASKLSKLLENIISYLKSNTVSDWINGNSSVVHFEQSLVKKNIDAKILHLDNKKLTIIEKVFTNKIALEEISVLWRGEEIGKNSEILDCNAGKGKLKILSGSNISKYIIKGEIKYIHKKDVKKSLELYKKSKILVRQLGETINATLITNGEITTQSVYNIVPIDKTLEFILGILNSKVIDFIYQFVFREKMEFPRILLENLKLLPIPNVMIGTTKSYTALVYKIILAKIKNHEADTSYFEKQLDLMVYKLYSLTYDEVLVIDKEFEKQMSREEYEKLDYGFVYEQPEETEIISKPIAKKSRRGKTNESIQDLEL